MHLCIYIYAVLTLSNAARARRSTCQASERASRANRKDAKQEGERESDRAQASCATETAQDFGQKLLATCGRILLEIKLYAARKKDMHTARPLRPLRPLRFHCVLRRKAFESEPHANNADTCSFSCILASHPSRSPAPALTARLPSLPPASHASYVFGRALLRYSLPLRRTTEQHEQQQEQELARHMLHMQASSISC